MSQKGFTYTLNLQAETQDLMNRINATRKSMETILSSGKVPGIEKTFDSLEKSLTKLQEKASQPITTTHQFESLQKEANSVFTAFERLGNSIEALRSADFKGKMDLLPPDLKKKIEDIEKALTGFNKVQEQSKQKSEQLIQAEKNLKAAKEALLKAEEKQSTKKALVGIQEKAVEASKAEAKAILEKKNALEKFLKTQNSNKEKGLEGAASYKNIPIGEIQGAKNAVPGLDLKDISAVESAIQQLTDEYNQAEKNTSKATKALQEYKDSLDKSGASAQVAKEKVDKLEKETSDLNTEFENNKVSNIQKAYAQLRAEANRLGISLKNIPVEYSEDSFEQLKLVMEQVATNTVSGLDQQLNGLQIELAETGNASDTLANKMNSAGAEVKELDDKVRNTEAFTQRIAQFVGLQGGIQIARNAMRNAINTIKELDAAMTEMAVVTDLEVGDYWNQLPQHTKRANDLGLAIKGVYEAETLYYQQGLKTNEVIAMSNETLKMARIAGLSAEDATNKMTAALRGFNMELNETSAQRISDVYSELAAITAADVDEISSAMTKTASIASSAGMEFETTAAFLSQIIETTRESAETAGTAMKTVIARFQELKKDPAEIGEIDGEIVDANKIETALRSVGVALRDTSGQFRDLDDVFLELSSKWDGLDTNTQRYIATIAAGSRQQSRFIAMMSDYNRTQELVTAANTSAGASNKQFEKTMDSLEAKLNKLKNAWDSFTLGIMDSEILKVGVDLLTGLLTAINNITDAFGDFSGAAKIGLLITALYLGDKALKVFMGSIKTGTTIFGAFGAVGKSAIGGIHKALLGIKNANKIINAKESAQAVSAMDAYRKATEKAQKATKMQNTLMQQNNLTASKQAIIDKALVQSQDERRQAVTQYATALGLSNTQTAAAVAMSASEAGMDQICAAAVGGLTEERYKEMTAQMIAQGLSAEEIKKRQQAIISLYAEKGANDLNNKTEQMGLLLKAKAVVALLFGNKAKRQSAMESLGMATAEQIQAASTGAATGAQWSLNAAMLANPIGWIIVLIVALVAALTILVVWLIKTAKAASIEGRLKTAEKATENAAEAAEEAAEEYNNLSDAFDSLEDKYKALDELAEGTQEWKEAIKEVNQEVLDLIEQYPELASLVQKENSVLTLDIDSKEAQAILSEYETKSIARKNAELGAKISLNEIKQEKTAEENRFKMRIQTGTQTYQGETINTYGSLSNQTMEKLASAIASGELIDSINDSNADLSNEIQDWVVKNGTAIEQTYANTISFNENLDELTSDLRKAGMEINELEEQNKAFLEAMALNATQLIDQSMYTAEELAQINASATAEYTEIFFESAKESLQKEIEDFGGWGTDLKEWTIEKAKEYYDATDVKADKYGTIEEIDGEEVNIEAKEFQDALAAESGTKEMTTALANLPMAINNLTKQVGSAGRSFEKAFKDKEGKELTKKDIEQIRKYSDDDLREMYRNMGDADQASFGNEDNFIAQTRGVADNAEVIFEGVLTTLKEVGAQIELNSRLSSGVAQGYYDQLERIYAAQGQAGLNKIDTALNSLAGSLSDDQFQTFMSQLYSFDWKDQNAWEDFSETLKKIGIYLPQDELEEFIETASKTAGAIREADLSKLNEQMGGLQKIIKNIDNREQSRIFDSSTYEALINMNEGLASQFSEDLDGNFVYLGNSMEDLRKAIIDNTNALLGETTSNLQNKFNAHELMAALVEVSWTHEGSRELDKPISLDIRQWASWEDNFVDSYIQSIIDNREKYNIDLDTLGVSGLSNEAVIENMSQEVKTEIMEGLAEIFNKNGEIINSLRNETASIYSKTYQNEDAAINSKEASRYRSNMLTGKKLSIEEQGQLMARTNALAIQAASVGVNKIAINNYTTTINKMKDLEEEFNNGTKTLEEFKREYGVLTKQVERFEQTIANKTNLKETRKNLESTIEQLAEMVEGFENTTDSATKLEQVSEAAAMLGIDIASLTTMTETEIAELLNTALSQGENSIGAMLDLLTLAGQQMGLSFEEIAKMGTMTWDQMLADQTGKYIEFANFVKSLGLGTFEEIDGTLKFSWTTRGMYNDVVGEFGIDSEEVEKWQSSYTWLYNYNEAINTLIRERTKLEREYNRALENETKTSADLIELSKQQLNNLWAQSEVASLGAQKAYANIEQLFKENPLLGQFAKYDAISNEIVINDNALASANLSSEEGSKFEELLGILEENRDVIDESYDTIADIEEEVDEIKNRGRDEASEIRNTIKEGIVTERQQEIDKLSEINDSIIEAQNKLVEQMQEQIEQERQMRENEKTQRDISDKKTRLQFLKSDTSGKNSLEILALEKEIAEYEQNHIDNLIDQKFDSIQQANDFAAEQRNQQIELAQAQLNAYAASQKIWTDVETILNSSYKQDIIWKDTEAAHYIAVAENWKEMNPIEKQMAIDESAQLAKLGYIYTNLGGENADSIQTLAQNTQNKIDGNKTAIGQVSTDIGTLGDTKIPDAAYTIVSGLGYVIQAINKTGKYAPTPDSDDGLFENTDPIIEEEPKETINWDTPWHNYEAVPDEYKDQVVDKETFTKDETKREGYSTYRTYLKAKFEKAKAGATDLSLQEKKPNAAIVEDNTANDLIISNTPQYVSDGTRKTVAILEKEFSNPDRQVVDEFTGQTYFKIGEGYYDKEDFGPLQTRGGQSYRTAYALVYYKQYKTGGLADFTGPAWLDGTKSQPELVLNSRDTANFIQLKDILSDIMRDTNLSSQTSAEGNGDNYFDIDINVENLGEDYDVEQLANKIKSMIYEDSTYRNVNTINFVR